MSNLDFPETRRYLAALNPWLQEIAKTCGVPTAFTEEGCLCYKFQQQTPDIVQTAKAVRMVSGLNATMCLIDLGHTVEAATLLRTVTDFANEIIAIGEGLDRGELTSAQSKFVEDYFKPLPTNLDDFIDQDSARYVGRKELYKSHKRLAEEITGRGEELVDKSRYRDKVYDLYVHGGYQTAMELFDPYSKSFSVTGTPSAMNRCIAKVDLAGKLYYCMVALEMMARLRGLSSIVSEIRQARNTMEKSTEYDGSLCE